MLSSRQPDTLEQALRTALDDAAKRTAQRDADLAAVQTRFAGDLSNTQALNDALAAVNSRYQALSVADNDRIEAAQAALDKWDQAEQAQARAAASAAAR